MPWKESQDVPEGNGPVPQQDVGSGQPTLEELSRLIDGFVDRWDKWLDGKFEKISDRLRTLEQHEASLEHGARQPRLAMEADGPANMKTRERTEGAATAVQAMRGDSFSASWVEPGPKTNPTSFGMEAEPPDLPFIEDVVVECGDAAPKSCLPSLEMRPSTAAGDLVPTGESSTTTETSFNQPPLRFCVTEGKYSGASSKGSDRRTSALHASLDSNVFFQKGTLPASPYCRRVVETKSRQNTTFDPGGSQGHHRARLFLVSWLALVCGEVVRDGDSWGRLQRFFANSLCLFVTKPALYWAAEGGSRLQKSDE